MKLLIMKELKLAISPLAWCFLSFALMAFLPGYPIALGAFFICMGLFQSVQMAREGEDTLYSALLPIRKRDVVSAKFISTGLIEGIGLVAMTIFAILRMTVLSTAEVYVQNALLPANLTFLGLVLLIFGLFNLVFWGGFFKTAYYYGKPFIVFICLTMVLVLVGEVLWHIPGLEFLGAITPNGGQAIVLAVCALLFVAMTFISWNVSKARFERIDL